MLCGCLCHLTYGLGGRDGGSVFDCPGMSSVMMGDREGKRGGRALRTCLRSNHLCLVHVQLHRETTCECV